ncbi:transcriptional activator Mut3p [Fusarium subglutinans]|uniref:Transcriptional activator Mut3p n=1 Tax=Gibberella subglutinans TaxID=42677 RepID=A0A8H5UT27_GIBSU|nr:transcriptional activator Mut3p [Fusarium subglutinans]KAF5596434.1 transcriptional activator Mut3p [Fusarium subglutinans]
MRVASHARRRKAWDLCVSRKIKCDLAKPTCSDCKLYGVDYSITEFASPVTTSRRRAPASETSRASSSSTPSRDDTIESRLAHIEARLNQIAAEKPAEGSPHDVTALNFQNFPEIRVYKASDMWNEATTLPCLGISPQFPTGSVLAQTGKRELPPLQEVTAVLERHFESYGRYMPLFDKGCFMKMTVDWYSETGTKELIPWAAINLVLAMTYRIVDDVPIEEPKLAQCMRTVQSVTTELMAWSGDILGLQIRLGMFILFQGTTNPQLAIVLIGSAIRPAQSMGLPSTRTSHDPDESAQRHRVFWIAYILDKDLALRAKSPYTQFDAETDLELPEPIHGTFAFDETWIDRARCYLSPAAIPTGDDGIDGRINQKEISSLPSAWTDCVELSRLGLELSAFGRETEYSTWLHACCNLSGLIVLLVNIIEFPDQPSVVSDWSLIVRSGNKYDPMNAKASKEPFFLLQVAHELDRKASGQVKRLAHISSLNHQEAAFSEPWANPDLMFL